MINGLNNSNNVRFSVRSNQVKMLDRDGKLTGEVIGEEFKDADMPVYDFAEYMAEKMGFPDTESFFEYLHGNRELPEDSPLNSKTVEINGQIYNSDEIPIAEIDLFKSYKLSYDFTPTGDSSHDYQIKMGMNYNKSCINDENWQDYEKLTAEEDFTGMSPAEIYKAIYEKYQHCYGENFIDINAVPYVRPTQSDDSFGKLIDKFYNELEKAVGSSNYADVQKARREALYGDMDDYDVRAAIIEKYKGDDGITNSDLYKITAEMDRCGVGGGMHSPLKSVLTKDRSQILYNSTLGIKTSVEDSCAMHEAMLASPADTYLIDGILRHSSAMGTTNSELNSAVDQLREACNGYSGNITVNSVGNAANDSESSGFAWIKL